MHLLVFYEDVYQNAGSNHYDDHVLVTGCVFFIYFNDSPCYYFNKTWWKSPGFRTRCANISLTCVFKCSDKKRIAH
jgi:hypothetical protein